MRDGEVFLNDALVGEIAQTIQGKNSLDHDGAAQQKAELNGCESDDGDNGITQCMLKHHAASGENLGTRGTNIVGAEHFEHASTDQAHKGGRRVVSQGNRGHDKMLPAITS